VPKTLPSHPSASSPSPWSARPHGSGAEQPQPCAGRGAGRPATAGPRGPTAARPQLRQAEEAGPSHAHLSGSAFHSVERRRPSTTSARRHESVPPSSSISSLRPCGSHQGDEITSNPPAVASSESDRIVERTASHGRPAGRSPAIFEFGPSPPQRPDHEADRGPPRRRSHVTSMKALQARRSFGPGFPLDELPPSAERRSTSAGARRRWGSRSNGNLPPPSRAAPPTHIGGLNGEAAAAPPSSLSVVLSSVCHGKSDFARQARGLPAA